MEGNLLLGHSIRYMGTCALYAYMPIVFGTNFPDFKSEYSTMSAMVIVGFGMTTSILEGLLSDRFQRENIWTNTLLNLGQISLSIPIILYGFWAPDDFYRALTCLALLVLCGGSAISPSI